MSGTGFTQPTRFFKQVSLDSTMEILADRFNAEAAGVDQIGRAHV